MPKFIITNRKNGRQEKMNLNKETITIGRLPNNDIVLDGTTVSRKHAEITQIKGNYFLADAESGNGTIHKGKKLPPLEKVLLQNNDKFQIEDFEIKYIEENPAVETDSGEETNSEVIEIKMIKKVLSALNTDSEPSLEVLTEPCLGKKIVFGPTIKELVIGRETGCELAIDSSTISRRHAVLQKKWGGVTISDLKSKNGILVNNEKCEEKTLKDGDILTIGIVKILFRNPQEINLEDLSKEYEKSNPAINVEEPKEEKISAQAKISLDEKKIEPKKVEEEPAPKKAEPQPEIDPEESKPKTAPEPEIKTGLFSILSRFSTSEKIMMGLGIVMFIAALYAFISLIF